MGALMALTTPITVASGVMILIRAPIWTRALSAMASWRSRMATAWLPETDTIWARRIGGAAGRPRRSRKGGAAGLATGFSMCRVMRLFRLAGAWKGKLRRAAR